ncbi:MAG: hypothetical protein KBA26_14315 [Candidatus Delongbacteria bacterium]|nr:hypothetical protein [Candidatus Delongbacteria bacterium]
MWKQTRRIMILDDRLDYYEKGFTGDGYSSGNLIFLDRQFLNPTPGLHLIYFLINPGQSRSYHQEISLLKKLANPDPERVIIFVFESQPVLDSMNLKYYRISDRRVMFNRPLLPISSMAMLIDSHGYVHVVYYVNSYRMTDAEETMKRIQSLMESINQ